MAGGEVWKFYSRGSRKVKFFSQAAAREKKFHSIMSLNHAKKVWNYHPQKSMKFFPRGGGIFILFLGWEEFYNINSYYFRVTINFTENYVKVNVIVWIYVIKFFSPQKKYGISSPVGEEIPYYFRVVNFILFHTFFAWFSDIIEWDSMNGRSIGMEIPLAWE